MQTNNILRRFYLLIQNFTLFSKETMNDILIYVSCHQFDSVVYNFVAISIYSYFCVHVIALANISKMYPSIYPLNAIQIPEMF